jgi:hypothetical protein
MTPKNNTSFSFYPLHLFDKLPSGLPSFSPPKGVERNLDILSPKGRGILTQGVALGWYV